MGILEALYRAGVKSSTRVGSLGGSSAGFR